MDRAQHRGPSAMTESQMFPIQPDLTQSLSILSYDFQVLEISIFFSLNTTRQIGVGGITTKTILQLILLLQETHISSKNVTLVSVSACCCHSFLATKVDNVFHFNIFLYKFTRPGGIFRIGSLFLEGSRKALLLSFKMV